MELTSQECRDRFQKYNLSYDDVRKYILTLITYLDINLKEFSKNNSEVLSMILNKRAKYNKNGGIYLFVNGPYFSHRECISFNDDGFIGFCGWADSKNAQPIYISFIQWCEYIRYIKKIK